MLQLVYILDRPLCEMRQVSLVLFEVQQMEQVIVQCSFPLL